MANVVDTVAIKMVVDASGVKDGIGATTKEITEATRIVNSMRTPLERLEEKERRLQELFAKGAVDDIPKYERALQAIADAKRRLVSANDHQIASERNVVISQKEVIKNLSILGDLIKFHVIARGMQMVANGFREMAGGIREAVSRLDEIGDTAAKLGMPASDLQRLRIQANLSEVSFDNLTSSIEKLMVRSADAAMGNRDLQKTFGLLGISMSELQGMSDAERFNRVTQALSQITDRATRLSIITDLFGRGNTDMITYIDNLQRMNGVIDQTKAVMSNEDLARIDEADTAIKVMMHSLEGVYNVAAVELAPAITDIANELSRFFSQDLNSTQLVTGFRTLSTLMSASIEEAKIWMAQFKLLINMLPEGSPEGQQVGRDLARAARINEESRRQKEFLENRQRIIDSGAVPEGTAMPRTLEEQRELLKLIDEEQAKRDRASNAEKLAAEQTEQSFTQEQHSLQEQNILLSEGREAWQQWRDARAGYNAEQQDYLTGLRDENAQLRANQHAQEEYDKAARERMSEAERIRQSNMTQEEAAAARLQRAQDLVTTGELSKSDFDRMLEREARGLDRGKGEFRLSASSFGSQAAIAATLGRAQGSDSDRLESIKNSLLELVRKPAVEVEEVGAI